MKISKNEWCFSVNQKTGKIDIHVPNQKTFPLKDVEKVFDGAVKFLCILADYTGRGKIKE